jgi:hypothetical protein
MCVCVCERTQALRGRVGERARFVPGGSRSEGVLCVSVCVCARACVCAKGRGLYPEGAGQGGDDGAVAVKMEGRDQRRRDVISDGGT